MSYEPKKRVHDRSWTKKDFDIQWFSGTGAGGQHRNKHQNCVRLVDKETGLSAVGQSHSDRRSNLKDALETLAKRLMEHHYPTQSRPRVQNPKVIRTYNEVDNRVVDEVAGKFVFGDFDIGDVIPFRLAALTDEEE